MSLPEPPVNPPELSDEEEARDERNWARDESMELIDRLIANLDFLDHDGIHRHSQKYLAELQDYLERDMED